MQRQYRIALAVILANAIAHEPSWYVGVNQTYGGTRTGSGTQRICLIVSDDPSATPTVQDCLRP